MSVRLGMEAGALTVAMLEHGWLRRERSDFLELLRALTDDDWARPTERPAWTVKQVALHVLGDDLSLLSRQRDALRRGSSSMAPTSQGRIFVSCWMASTSSVVTASTFLSTDLLITLLELTGDWTTSYYETVDLHSLGEPVGFFGSCHDASVTSPHVNYERAAPEYAKRRTPTNDRLAIWGKAVARYVSNADLAIDLAAGAGGFSAALRDWGARRVVAVEPSPAMQAEASSAGSVPMVRARAEAIPLRDDVADLIWISTAFHHFTDPHSSAAECRRVLNRSGHLIVRGFVPGHTELAWLELFPGSEKAIAVFPSIDTMNSILGRVSFELVHERTVKEGTQTYAQRADFSEEMRSADSILTALTDDEVAQGVAALRSQPDEIEHFALSLLVYRES